MPEKSGGKNQGKERRSNPVRKIPNNIGSTL